MEEKHCACGSVPDLAFCLLVVWELLNRSAVTGSFSDLGFWVVFSAESFGNLLTSLILFFFLISIFCSSTFSSFFPLEAFHLSFYCFSFRLFPWLLQHFIVWSWHGFSLQFKSASLRIHSVLDSNSPRTISILITDKTHEFSVNQNCRQPPQSQHQEISIFQKFHGFLGENALCCLC